MKLIKLIGLIFLMPVFVVSQYDINGDAIQTSCNCYELTQPTTNQVGSVWNINKIDLNNSFDYLFEVYFGNSDAGADGIVFGLQPISTSIGVSGGGMGLSGVSPSLGVFMDTYQNGVDSDPADDHISINQNGDVGHASANNLDGPIGLGNIEDGVWHDFQVTWDAPAQTLSAYFDGVLSVQYTGDIINTIFGGDPNVFWGFTSATGGAFNTQGFCTKLEAEVDYSLQNAYCLNEDIQFIDGSESFGNILSWSWDVDSDDIVDYTTPNIIHSYDEIGTYEISLIVKDESGCEVEEVIEILIEDPILDVVNSELEACSPFSLNLSDNVIDVNELSGGIVYYSDESLTTSLSETLELTESTDVYALKITDNGCKDTVSFTINVTPTPDLQVTEIEECDGTILDLDNSIFDLNPDTKDLVDPTYYSSSAFDFEISNEFTVSEDINQIYVIKTTPWLCSDTVIIPVKSVPIPIADLGIDTTKLCQDQEVLTLSLSQSEVSYLWSTGSTGSSIDIYFDGEYSVTAKNACGVARDTILVETCECYVYVPNSFTPNDDQLNDTFIPIYDCNVAEYDFRIFNRWGDVIFQTNDPYQHWDGIFSGKKVPNGVYAYSLEINDIYKIGSVLVVE